MTPIEWAFAADVPHAEKLVLVWLASRANAVGVGLWDRERLEAATGYSRRSTQRILKALRDADLVAEAGDWYVLNLGNGVVAGPLPERDDLVLAPGPAIPMREPGAVDIDWLLETLASAAADAVNDQLASFETRLERRLAMVHVEHMPPEPPPPPDPVLEDPRFQQLIDMGFSEEAAYANVERLLEQGDPVPGPESPPLARPASASEANGSGEGHYPDSPLGRLQRVSDTLGSPVTDAARAQWRALEAEENKYSVKGEVPAFEQLYPAIVGAARRAAGSMTLEGFLAADPPPWDTDPAPAPAEDAALQAEIESMLAELGAVNDPRATVQPRTVETGDDGVRRTEPIVAYHRRVRAKYDQVKHLQSMGVIDG